MSTPAARAAELRDIIVIHYLETGKDGSVKTLAEWSGRSESWIRRVLTETHGAPAGCTSFEDSVPTYSRSYPGWQHGATTVRVYGPTRTTLRSYIADNPDAMPARPKSYDAEGEPFSF